MNIFRNVTLLANWWKKDQEDPLFVRCIFLGKSICNYTSNVHLFGFPLPVTDNKFIKKHLYIGIMANLIAKGVTA